MDVVIFGEAAWDTIIVVDRVPGVDEAAVSKKQVERPGGMSLNVALFLAHYGVKVGFNFKVGSDPYGSKILDKLKSEGVRVSPIVEDGSETLRTIIITDCKGFKNSISLLKPNVALTITKPSEVDFSLLETSRIAYIGGVYVETAGAIADRAYRSGIMTVYRPGYPFYQIKPFETLRLTKKFNICVMNRPSWKALSRRVGLRGPEALLRERCNAVVVTSEDGARLYTSTGDFHFKPGSKGGNVIGIGDFFTATMMKKLIDGYSIESTVEYSVEAAEKYSKIECPSIRVP